MGSRGNIHIVQRKAKKGAAGAGIYLYTHWLGDDLPALVQNVLGTNRERWRDEGYLAAAFVRGLTDASGGDVGGIGITHYLTDADFNVVVVDSARDKVGFAREGELPRMYRSWSFEEYVGASGAILHQSYVEGDAEDEAEPRSEAQPFVGVPYQRLRDSLRNAPAKKLAEELDAALVEHNLELARVLVAMGGRPSDHDQALAAALDSGSEPMVQLLFGVGLRGRPQTRHLHRAAMQDMPLAVQGLLDRGADASARDARGRTALHYANSIEVARLLLGAGASADAADDTESRLTPRDVAQRRGDEALLALFDSAPKPKRARRRRPSRH